MPSMDSNGKSDPYCSCYFLNPTVPNFLAIFACLLISCHLQTKEKTPKKTSEVRYATLHPIWDQIVNL